MQGVLLAGAAVGVSLAICLAVLLLQKDRPVDSRGMVGLGCTVIHLLATLILAGCCWLAGWVPGGGSPLPFVIGLLAFYWLSLIILVLLIIRWIKGGPAAVQRKDQENSACNKEP